MMIRDIFIIIICYTIGTIDYRDYIEVINCLEYAEVRRILNNPLSI